MITPEDIKHLADLSRIEVTDEETKSLTKEVDSILDYVGQIQSVTGSMENNVSKLHNVIREDVVTNNPRQYTEDLLKNAPSREGDHLKVKKIL